MEITKNDKIILRCNFAQKAIQYAGYAANVLGSKTKVADCVSFKVPADLVGLLTSLDENEVLVLYNIGLLDNSILEYLHGAILNQRIDIPIGDGNQKIEMDIKPFVPILIVNEEEPLPGILNDINFKKYDADKFHGVIKDTMDTYFMNKRSGQTTPEESFLYLCFSQKDQLDIYPLCKELDNKHLPYMMNPISEFNGWYGIIENLSNIESAKLFMWVDSDKSRKDEYIADMVDYARKIKDNNEIIDYVIDTSEESIKDFCIKIEKKLGLDSEGLLSKVESLLSKDCFDEAVELIDKARQRGYITDGRLFKYAKICSDKGAYVHAMDLYEIAASHGYAPAQCNLGWHYSTVKNYAEAIKWYRAAAEQGDDTAQNNLGICYENGHGVKQNQSEAIKWYLKSFANGNKNAKENLQHMSNEALFEFAHDKAENEDIFLLYKIAAERGFVPAQCNLGWCYDTGTGVSQNKSEAIKWYRKAAEKGNDCAQYNLAQLYEKGLGTPVDINEAINWYEKAAKQNYKDAKEKADALIKENSLSNKIFKLFK